MSLKNDIIEAEFRTKGASVVQREMSKISKEIAILTDKNKDLKLAKAKLEAADKKYIAGTKKLTAEYKSVNDKIKQNNELLTIQKGKLQVQASQLKLSEMSSSQLKKKWRELNKELDDPIMKVLPERQKKLSKELTEVEKHMGRVGAGTKKTNSVLTNMKQLLPTIGIMAVVGWVMKLGSELFTLSKTIQGEAIRSTTVLGDQMGYVEGQAEKLADKMGVTNREFVSMVANTADLLIPLDFTRKKAADMASQVQGLAGALDEWTAGKLGVTEVSNILTKAMLGEMEQLKQLGIAIKMDSEEYRTLVKQKKAEEGATHAQAQALATLELLYKKSADAQTAYQKKGNQLLRLQKSLSLWWKQLKEDVANYLITSSSDRLLKQADDLQKIEKQFANEERTLTSLLVKYDSLKTKGNLTKEEQLQLNAAIRDIGNIVPTAITEFNKYGDAIGINKDKIIEAREAQRLLNLEMKEDVINDLVDGVDEYVMDIERANGQIKARNELLNDETKMQAVINNTGMERSKIENNNLMAIRDQQDAIKEANTDLAQTLLKLKDIGLTEEEVSSKTGLSAERMNGIIKNYLATISQAPTVDPVTTSAESLVKVQEKLLDQAKLMPQSTEQEIYARNQKIQTIEKEIKRLSELGIVQGNLDKFIQKSNEDQVDAIKEYFKGVGAGAYEGFKKAYEDAASQEPLNLLPVSEEEEENTDDPDTNYEIQQYMQTLEFKEELLRVQRENGIIGEKEYQDELDKINKEHEKKRFDQKMAYNQKAQQMVQFGANFVNALMQLELENAGDNEEKKKEIRKKYAVMQFMTSASGIIVNTAGAVMKALEQLGPIAGPIAAGIIGATGGVQLGIAYAEMQKVRGMEDGGFTKVRRAQDNKEFRARYSPNRRGFIDKPTVLVGEADPEFVANGSAVKNPSVKPFLDVIDAAQRAGTIETLNLPAVMNSMAVEGRERGGYTKNTTDSTDIPEPSNTGDNIQEMTVSTLQELNSLIKKGFRAYVVFGDIEDKMDEVETVKNNANY